MDRPPPTRRRVIALAALLALGRCDGRAGGETDGDQEVKRMAEDAQQPIRRQAGGVTLWWIPEDAPGFGAPVADAHLAFFTRLAPDGAAALLDSLAPGETLWVTDRFRDPSAPWRIGEVPTDCAENQRCASAQPSVYALIGADGCRGGALFTGASEISESLVEQAGRLPKLAPRHAEPVTHPAWAGRMALDGAPGFFFATLTAAEAAARGLDADGREAAVAALAQICR